MLAALVLALLALPHAHAQNLFILTIGGANSYQRLDPIVNPGQVSSHVHTILGVNEFNPLLTEDQQTASTCTSAPVQQDKSSYWAQSLYHRDSNGELTLIPLSFANIYYLQRPTSTDPKLTAIPAGLRMVAGNVARTSYNASNVEDKAINFVCLSYNDPSNDASPQPTFPQKPCPDGMRAQVVFRSCWDGKNLDSPDHKSHMSYPVGGAPDSGDCPSTHPVKLVTLFNEYAYDTGKFSYTSGGSSWVFASGEDKGYSFHADVMSNWRGTVLQDALNECQSPLFGDLEKCAPLAASLDRNLASKCTGQNLVQEDVMGPLAQLPGCNPFVPGKPRNPQAQCAGLAVPAISGYSGAQSAAPVPSSTAAASSVSAVASSVKSASLPAGSSTIVGLTSTNVLAPVRTVSTSSHVASSTGIVASASSVLTGAIPTASSKTCKRSVGPSRRSAEEDKYLRAVRAHHAGVRRHAASH